MIHDLLLALVSATGAGALGTAAGLAASVLRVRPESQSPPEVQREP